MVGAIGPKTKLLYLCTPNNPTGTVLKQAEFDWLMERIPKDVLVIVDLAYDNYATDNDRFQVTEAALQYRNVCYLHTFSKLYGLAGLRVGYGLGHPDVWSYVHRVREPFNVNRLAQTGAIAALADVDHVQSSQALAAQSRAQYARLNEVGIHVVPSQANFTLIDVKDGVRVFERLKKEGILVRAGYPGLTEYVRVTFGLPEDNERCIQGILQLVGS
jgi:histidinol-phosphate aminotransferase